jgi:hypothetical protein
MGQRDRHGVRYWLCRCGCGNQKSVSAGNLRSGAVASCGCSRKTHGASDTRTYRVWWAMIARCRYKRMPFWVRYGGRGIRVCWRWKKFENFLADMGEAPPGLTLDRKNNDGNYSPSNCWWATQAEQERNKDHTRYIDHKGQRMCVTDWAAVKGLKINLICTRLSRGWSVERALETEPIPRSKPPSPCRTCSKMCRIRRNGLCNACYLRLWRRNHAATV